MPTKATPQKGPKPKKVNFQIVMKSDAAWSVLEKALRWHKELNSAQIGLAWRKALKADVDGHIVLGRCVKVSELHKEFFDFDFVVVLNKEFWDDFDDDKRLALIDHELCHAAAALDSEYAQKEDERGRLLWRVRKHDIEEFREVVQRHGCYKSDLEEFAKALRDGKKNPLFSKAS